MEDIYLRAIERFRMPAEPKYGRVVRRRSEPRAVRRSARARRLLTELWARLVVANAEVLRHATARTVRPHGPIRRWN